MRWIGTVESMDAAKTLIKTESAKLPGDFLVVDLDTGHKVEIKGDAAQSVGYTLRWNPSNVSDALHSALPRSRTGFAAIDMPKWVAYCQNATALRRKKVCTENLITPSPTARL